MKSISIIIPCYNESAGIANLSNKLKPILGKLKKNYSVELIFVDDGSTDNTFKLLKDNFNSAKIIRHKKNMNLGAAMRTGFKHSGGDIIITIDSDCTYDPETMIDMLKLLDEKTDIVTVSPYHPEGKVENVPEYRLVLSRAISLIYRILLGKRIKKIYTFTALNRAYKNKVIKNIKFESDNFLATAQILIYALQKGYKVKELPAVLHVRKYGTSKIRLLSVIISHFNFVLKLMFSRKAR